MHPLHRTHRHPSAAELLALQAGPGATPAVPEAEAGSVSFRPLIDRWRAAAEAAAAAPETIASVTADATSAFPPAPAPTDAERPTSATPATPPIAVMSPPDFSPGGPPDSPALPPAFRAPAAPGADPALSAPMQGTGVSPEPAKSLPDLAESWVGWTGIAAHAPRSGPQLRFPPQRELAPPTDAASRGESPDRLPLAAPHSAGAPGRPDASLSAATADDSSPHAGVPAAEGGGPAPKTEQTIARIEPAAAPTVPVVPSSSGSIRSAVDGALPARPRQVALSARAAVERPAPSKAPEAHPRRDFTGGKPPLASIGQQREAPRGSAGTAIANPGKPVSGTAEFTSGGGTPPATQRVDAGPTRFLPQSHPPLEARSGASLAPEAEPALTRETQPSYRASPLEDFAAVAGPPPVEVQARDLAPAQPPPEPTSASRIDQWPVRPSVRVNEALTAAQVTPGTQGVEAGQPPLRPQAEASREARRGSPPMPRTELALTRKAPSDPRPSPHQDVVAVEESLPVDALDEDAGPALAVASPLSAEAVEPATPMPPSALPAAPLPAAPLPAMPAPVDTPQVPTSVAGIDRSSLRERRVAGGVSLPATWPQPDARPAVDSPPPASTGVPGPSAKNLAPSPASLAPVPGLSERPAAPSVLASTDPDSRRDPDHPEESSGPPLMAPSASRASTEPTGPALPLAESSLAVSSHTPARERSGAMGRPAAPGAQDVLGGDPFSTRERVAPGPREGLEVPADPPPPSPSMSPSAFEAASSASPAWTLPTAPGLTETKSIHEPPAVFHGRLSAAPDSPHFAPALGTQLHMLLANGVAQARLELHPAELGPIELRIELEGRQAFVSMGAELPSTRQALEAAVPQLSATLADAGFTLLGGSVGQSAADQPGRGSEGARLGTGATGEDTSGPETAAAAPRELRGLVDLYV